MTVQPELDFATGLIASVPVHDRKNGGYDLEVNPSNCVPIDDKIESVPTDASIRSAGSRTGVSRTNRIAFSVYLDEGKAFNPVLSLASRRTYFADDDERYAVMRKAVVNAARIAVANGKARMPEGYTLDDLNKLKGFKWSPKAGCSMCPCSPAFMSPLLAVDGYNWASFSFKVKQGESIATVIDLSVADQVSSQLSRA